MKAKGSGTYAHQGAEAPRLTPVVCHNSPICGQQPQVGAQDIFAVRSAGQLKSGLYQCSCLAKYQPAEHPLLVEEGP